MMIAVIERLLYGLSKLQIPSQYQQVDNSLLVESYNINKRYNQQHFLFCVHKEIGH